MRGGPSGDRRGFPDWSVDTGTVAAQSPAAAVGERDMDAGDRRVDTRRLLVASAVGGTRCRPPRGRATIGRCRHVPCFRGPGRSVRNGIGTSVQDLPVFHDRNAACAWHIGNDQREVASEALGVTSSLARSLPWVARSGARGCQRVFSWLVVVCSHQTTPRLHLQSHESARRHRACEARIFSSDLPKSLTRSILTNGVRKHRSTVALNVAGSSNGIMCVAFGKITS